MEFDSQQLYSTEDYSENMTIPQNYSSSDMKIVEGFIRNRRVHPPAYYLLISIYSCMIFIGAFGNLMVVCAVLRKATMRTTRNVFIFNLAVSDLLLCSLTMPFTLMEILTRYWPLGDTVFLCKLTGCLQAVSIFVSTLSITAIAMDRYYLVVYPTQDALQRTGAAWIVFSIWMISIVLALPLFIWRTLQHYPIHPIPGVALTAVDYCIEEWPFEHGRFSYSVFTIIIQYALPIITVSVAYGKIARQLRLRMHALASMTTDKHKKELEDKRVKKTKLLLLSISCIFALSWLPLNIFNMVVDLYNPFGDNVENMLISYAICHLVGMSSACSNPLLYGWLNEHFRKEFFEIFLKLKLFRQAQSENMKRFSVVRSSYRKAVQKGKAPVIIYTKATTTPTPSDIQALKQELTELTIGPTITTIISSNCGTPVSTPHGSPSLLRVTSVRFSAH